MADDDYVDGGVIEIVPVGAAVRLGATRIIAVVAVPLGLPRDERDYAAAPAGSIGLRALGMIGIADRQRANLGAPLPEGTSLTTIDPVVDVVGLFEVEPGLLRINRDYGWLRAADALAEGDPDLLADVAGVDPLPRRGALRVMAARGGGVGSGRDPRRSRLRARSPSCGSRRSASGPPSSTASSSASPCPRGARPGGASSRCTYGHGRRTCHQGRQDPFPRLEPPGRGPAGRAWA